MLTDKKNIKRKSSQGNDKKVLISFLESINKPANSPSSKWAIIHALEQDLDSKTLQTLSEIAFDLKLTKKEYAEYLHINVRTLNRNLKDNFTLDLDKKEKIFRLYEMMQRGVETFGNKEKFSRWIREYNSALQAKPIELFSSIAGIDIINDELIRIDYGVFS